MAFLRGSVILDHLHGAVRDADRGKVGHGLAVRLGVHGHALLAHRRQHLEVVDVVGWREGVEEFSFFLEGVRLVSPGETGISLCGLFAVDWIRVVGCGVVDDKGSRRIDIVRHLWFFAALACLQPEWYSYHQGQK